MTAPVQCACCDCPLEPAGEKNGYRLWRCAGCGFISTYPLPTPDQLRAVYDRNYFFGATHGNGKAVLGYSNILSEGAVRANANISRVRLGIIRELARDATSILDLGCAAGTFLRVAAEHGWSTTGAELNPEMRNMAKAHCTGNVVTEAISEINGRFDVVTMWEYLEHVPSPAVEIERVRSLLSPGGVVCMSFPNLESKPTLDAARAWEQVKPPEHLHYWNADNIGRFLDRHGFSVAGFRYHGHKAALEGVRVLGSRSDRKTPFWPLMSVFMRVLGSRLSTGFAQTFPPRTRRAYEGMEVYACLK